MAWDVFSYLPTSLFSLKSSRATSTVGRTLLVPTPYAVKMAFLDAGLRTGAVTDAKSFVLKLRKSSVRIGVPEEACVTGTIQKIRQEPKKTSPELPYISNIAFRELVYLRGTLLIAFDSSSCPEEIVGLAPAINYFGKRGSFFQFLGGQVYTELDATFTAAITEAEHVPTKCHLATLDDFGPDANFDALNSFSATPMKRGKHRIWVESTVPLGIFNMGPGFVHYRR